MNRAKPPEHPESSPLKAELDEQRRENLDKARELLTLSFLWQVIAAAEQQTDIATWRNVGGLEARDFLDCIERGLPHPLLRAWQRRMAENANRPAPSLGDLLVRRQVIRCCAALERNGMSGRRARAFVADELAPMFHGRGPSADAIRRWQQAQPLGPRDEAIINRVIYRAGVSNQQIVEYFAGLIVFGRDATVQAVPAR
jgi:hypothetical protein